MCDRTCSTSGRILTIQRSRARRLVLRPTTMAGALSRRPRAQEAPLLLLHRWRRGARPTTPS